MLSKRIEALILSLEKCHTLADIGCDHGYIAVEAIKRGIAKKVIATDLNKKPIEKAILLAQKENVTDRIDFLVGDGFEPITEKIDQAIVAGIGGELICRILENANRKLYDVLLILQPMKDTEMLRKWLFGNSFEIIEEVIIKEKQKYYVIIKAKKAQKVYYSDVDIYVGRHILKKNPISYEYLLKQKDKLSKIIENKNKFSKDCSFEKWQLDLIEEVLKKW